MKKKYVSAITLILSLIVIFLLYPKLQSPADLQAFVSQWGWFSIFIDLIIITLLALFPVIPFALIAGVNTLVFGWLEGFLLSLGGSLLGASIGFWLARALGQDWAQPKLQKLGKWSAPLKGNSFTIILISRLIPILPSAAVNYAAGLSLISYPKFLLASLLGKIPMIIWESWIGHDFWQITENPGRFFLAFLIGTLLLGTAILSFYISTKRFKKPT